MRERGNRWLFCPLSYRSELLPHPVRLPPVFADLAAGQLLLAHAVLSLTDPTPLIHGIRANRVKLMAPLLHGILFHHLTLSPGSRRAIQPRSADRGSLLTRLASSSRVHDCYRDYSVRNAAQLAALVTGHNWIADPPPTKQAALPRLA